MISGPLISRELTVSHHQILIAGPDGKKGGKGGGVNEVDGGEAKHDPAHRNHLGGGADFARPVRLNRNLFVDKIENGDATEDFEITDDDEDDEPKWEVPVDAPIDKSGGGEPAHKKGFIGDWVENGSGEGLLVEVSGDPAIDPVEHRGQGVDGKGKPAQRFIGRGSFDTATVSHRNPDEDRDEEETSNGNVGG